MSTTKNAKLYNDQHSIRDDVQRMGNERWASEAKKKTTTLHWELRNKRWLVRHFFFLAPHHLWTIRPAKKHFVETKYIVAGKCNSKFLRVTLSNATNFVIITMAYGGKCRKVLLLLIPGTLIRYLFLNGFYAELLRHCCAMAAHSTENWVCGSLYYK